MDHRELSRLIRAGQERARPGHRPPTRPPLIKRWRSSPISASALHDALLVQRQSRRRVKITLSHVSAMLDD